MGTFQADTLRDSIQSAWALTGALNKSVTSTRKVIVKFYAHPQAPETESKKAIYVQKQTPLQTVTHYPRWDQIRDVFTIQCRYTSEFAKSASWDTAEERMEDMTNEVERIVKTIYDPQSLTGVFWTSQFDWTNEDQIDLSLKVLRRTLKLELTYMKSRDTTVFEGNAGVLSFDKSASVGDSLPANDYIYTEVTNIDIVEGYGTTPVMTNDVTQGQNVPVLFSTMYSGQVNFTMYAKKADIDGSTAETVYKMFLLQASSPLAKELPTITLLHDVYNTEATPIKFQTSSLCKITQVRKRANDKGLVEFIVSGILTKPSTVENIA